MRRNPISLRLGEQTRELERVLGQAHGILKPKCIHDLRVLTRRIRSTLWLVDHASEKSSPKTLKRKLRRLGKALGERRSIDVACEDARNFGLDERELRPRRRRADRGVRKSLDARTKRQILKLLGRAQACADAIAPERLLVAFADAERRIGHWRRRHPRDRCSLHLLRIDVKKLRYLLEAFGGEPERLKRLQDLLGRGHDLAVLQELFGRHARVRQAERRSWMQARRQIHPALRWTEARFKILGAQSADLRWPRLSGRRARSKKITYRIA